MATAAAATDADTEHLTCASKGSGHGYRDFVAARMRRNGGNMKAAVADYLTLRKKANMLSA